MSESGRFCHAGGATKRGDRCRSVLVLPTFPRAIAPLRPLPSSGEPADLDLRLAPARALRDVVLDSSSVVVYQSGAGATGNWASRPVLSTPCGWKQASENAAHVIYGPRFTIRKRPLRNRN